MTLRELLVELNQITDEDVLDMEVEAEDCYGGFSPIVSVAIPNNVMLCIEEFYTIESPRLE